MVDPSAAGPLPAIATPTAGESSAADLSRNDGDRRSSRLSQAETVDINGEQRANFTVSVPSASSRSRRYGYQFAPQQLPKFSGDYAAWPTFYSLYLELVHNDDEISPTAKFNILLQHLVGDAAGTIAGIHPSDQSYELAWRLVVEQFDKPRLILQTLLQTLQRLRPLAEESVDSAADGYDCLCLTREIASNNC